MKTIKILSAPVIIVLLVGCATGAKKENMVYTGSAFDNNSYNNALKNEINVASVLGGEKTNPAWSSQISNEDFSGAVKSSLAKEGLLSETGRYQLRVNMLKVDQPLFGLDMTVTTHVRYVLTDKQDSSNILDETIVAPYTATMADALAGITRLRLANEGSGKKNIEGLLKKLSTLNIKPEEVSVVN